MIDFLRQLFDIATFPGRSFDEVRRIAKFCAVGVSGIIVNMIALAALKEWFGFPLLGASFVAIELSCISNFLLNDHWTFKGINAERPWLYRMLSFNGVSIGGMIINLMVIGILTSFGIYYIFANIIGILLGFGWNFIMNRKITWKMG